jgi:hypothetical protein
MITQEFQWSRSLVTILLRHTPKYIRRLSPKLRAQFLFCQLWYPLFAFTMALMFFLPTIALTLHMNLVNVTYPQFLLHVTPTSIILVLMLIRWRRSGCFRPYDARILSWESILFILTKWPWILAGVAAAIRDRIAGSFVDFRVTPKGSSALGALPTRVLAPYFIVSLLSSAAVLMIRDAGSAKGFYILAALNAFTYASVLTAISLTQWLTSRVKNRIGSIASFAQLGAAVLLYAPIVLAMQHHGLQGLQGLSFGAGPLEIVKTTYKISGADQGSGEELLTFEPHWRTVEEYGGG